MLATVDAGEARAPTSGTSTPFQFVDVIAPLVVVMFFVIKYEPFDNTVKFPGVVSSVVFPGIAIAVLAITPTERLRRVPIALSMFGLAFWLVASRLWTLSHGATDFAIRSEVPAFLLVAIVAGTVEPRRLMNVLAGAFTVIVAWSLSASILFESSRQVIVESEDDPQLGFRGMFDHKNQLGVVAVFALCFLIAFARGRTRPWLIMLTIATIVGTRSATAGSGLLAVMFIWFWILAIGRQRTPRERTLLLVTSIVSAVSAVLFALQVLPALLGIYQKDLTFSGRTVIWTESIQFIRERPLLGYGFGGVWTEDPPAPIAELRRQVGFRAAHAHNGALGIMLEVGLIGLGVVVVILVRVLALTVFSIRRPSISNFGTFGLTSLVALLLMSFSEPLFDGPDLGLVAVTVVILARVRNDHLSARDGNGLPRPSGSLARRARA